MNTFIQNLDEEIHRAAKLAAMVRGETMNDFIVRAIKTAVAKDPFAAKMLGLVRTRMKSRAALSKQPSHPK